MNNLNKTYYKFLSIVFLVTMPCLGVANETYEGKSLDEQYEVIHTRSQELTEMYLDNENVSFLEQTRMPKGKEELNRLLGTWVLSYKVGNTTHTDRLEMNKLHEFDDGRVGAVGKIFLNNKGDGDAFLCSSDMPPSLTKFFSSDYYCGGASETLGAFYLRVSGNQVTNGYYGVGETMDEMVALAMSKTIRVTGYREGTGSQLEANYNEKNNTLFIPVVTFQGSTYQVTLENTGNFFFSIKDVQPTTQKISGSPAIYDEASMALDIPGVKYQGSTYKLTLGNTGNFVFTIKNVQPIK